MTELTPSDITKFAQKTLIIKHQIDQLEGALDTYDQKGLSPDSRTIVKCYNKILTDCKKLFTLDSVFVEAISHIEEAKIFPDREDYQRK